MKQPKGRDDRSADIEDSVAIVNAIRGGEIDAFVIADPDCDRVYTLGSGEPPYRKMIEEMKEGAALLNLDGDVLYCNSHLAKLVDSTSASVILLPIARWIAAEDQPAFTGCLEKGKREPANVELRLVSGGGVITPVMLTASPMPVDGVTVICLIVSDLSLHQRTESERAARTEAERANRLKDEYVATVSHELRNPLNVIVSWLAMLRNRTTDADLVMRGLKAIERSALAQSKIIDDLLDIDRIRSGSLRLEVERFDLADVARGALETMLHVANDKNIQVEMAMEPVWVSGDPGRMNQVVGNLLSNAIKFTPEAGSIKLSVLQENGKACLRIVDSGEGINAEFLPHVFERFRQADGARTQRFGGLGLGLAIVKQLVELHGGTVSADSAGSGHGASFVVKLPLAPEQRTDEQPSEIVEVAGFEADLTGVSVMVVDDDPDGSDAVRRFLVAHHANVRVASSTEEALKEIARLAPDVLVSDIGMPDLDGYDLIQKMRANENDPQRRLPAIALTAFARPEDRERALRAGYDRHMSKPVQFSRLVSVIKTLSLTHKP